MSIVNCRERGGCCREQGSVEEAQPQWQLRHVVELVEAQPHVVKVVLEAQPQWRLQHVYKVAHFGKVGGAH